MTEFASLSTWACALCTNSTWLNIQLWTSTATN